MKNDDKAKGLTGRDISYWEVGRAIEFDRFVEFVKAITSETGK